MRTRTLILGLAVTLGSSVAAKAQSDDDGTRLERLIEDQMSEDGGFSVDLQGFRGALSSEAQLERLVISDRDGPWLTLEDAVLDWNRAALLTGELSVNALRAERVEVLRQPRAAEAEGIDLPPAEATPFSLPDLPVQINIGDISIGEVVLGEPVMGVAATLSVNGSATLADGTGAAALAVTRIGGIEGQFDLNASYSNETRELSLDLLLEEAAGGLVADLIDLPGAPPVRLTVAGAGPITDFSTDIDLQTDGQPRLTGNILTKSTAETGDQVIFVSLGGDISPLLVPEYRDFFGRDIALDSRVTLFGDGRVTLDDLSLSSAALQLAGNVALRADGQPDQFALTGQIADPDGGLVRLPVPGAETTVDQVTLDAQFDAAEGNTYTARFALDEFSAAEVQIARVTLDATGQITEGRDGQAILTAVTADLIAGAEGVAHDDPALAEAIGDTITMDAAVTWEEGAPVRMSGLTVTAGTLNLQGDASVDVAEGAAPLTFDVTANAPDLSRFAALAGQPIAGGTQASLSGSADLLSGAFDLDLNGTTTDLRVSDSVPPALFAGDTDLTLSALRDATGLTVDTLILDGTAMSLDATGRVSSTDGELSLTANLSDVGLFTDALSGPLRLETTLTRPTGSPWMIDADVVGPEGITASVTGSTAGSYTVDARIADIGSFTDTLTGPVTARADITGADSAPFTVDADLTGPGGITARVTGDVGLPDNAVDLQANGALPLSLANRALAPRSLDGTLRFNFAVDGPPSVSALRGTFETTGARVALPTAQTALEGVRLAGQISNGRAVAELQGNLASGGTLTANAAVDVATPSLPADITIAGRGLRLVDPTLYEAHIDTLDLSLNGSLLGNPSLSGDIVLGESEVRVPETGLGVASIPEITHVGETAGQRQTRIAAGLASDTPEAEGSGPDIALDLTITAPGRIFLRGRGLDAELGGTLRLTGTASDVVPQGRFELIRGRLSILGTRLDLTDGSATLQGSFDPFVRLLASSQAGEFRIDISVIGPASSPEITFASDPALPEDEVLAQLLFGRSVSSLSPVQVLQLADAAASLAGGSTNAGVFAQLRDGLGLDDLDLQTDDEGGGALRAGRYISENVYTDVTVGTAGDADVSLNIDLTDSVTARGTFSTDGDSSLGIFFERDY
ncbi:MAG: translocation/assembly module TamB domain-containing protein [Pseudomonadota bacterium]